jgi:hypothetical protein
MVGGSGPTIAEGAGAMRGLLVVFVLGLVGCVPLPVYRVQRSARVPRPAAPLRTGEPLQGPVELSLGSTVGTSATLVDKEAAIEVPRAQMRGEVRIKIRRGEIAPFFERAFESSFEALDATQAPVREGAPRGGGLATRYSFATGVPGLSIGAGTEVLWFSMPYVEYRTCVEYCEENGVSGTTMHTGSETRGSWGFSLTPTYRDGRVAVFGGVYSRRHPSIARKGTEIGGEYDRDIVQGNYNVMFHAGVEVRASVFAVMAQLQQDVTASPVQYGPSFGLALAIHAPPPVPRAPPPPEPSAPSWLTRRPPADADLPDDPW